MNLLGSESTDEATTETPETSEETTDTSAAKVFEVPDNIDFTLNSRINTVYYDNLDIKNVVGYIYIKDSRVVMEETQS